MKTFKGFIKIDESQFQYFVEALTPMIVKEDINIKECIKPHEMV